MDNCVIYLQQLFLIHCLLRVSYLENRLAKVLALEHRHKRVGRLVDALVDVLFAGDAAVREPLSHNLYKCLHSLYKVLV